VERDLWAYESQPKTAAAGPSRREAAKKATWTLVTHMVGMHHARPAPDVPYEQIRAEHDRLHSSGPAASTGA
jgi:hypothetical protein